MKRTPFVCANWKLHHRLTQTIAVLNELKKGASELNGIDIAVAPVATVLFAACDQAKNTPIKIAAQNVFYEAQGAFTGEWSVEHIRELGCQYAIVGHSERRQYFGETDDNVAKKVSACFEGGLIPIACVGETFEQRQRGEVKAILTGQVKALLSKVISEQVKDLIVAYEPVWAIGTGLTASAEAAQEAHLIIRQIVASQFGSESAGLVRIIYGGSVKAENAYTLAQEADIDGALVGGASLHADSFLKIAREIARARG